jgi:hypothetical protein
MTGNQQPLKVRTTAAALDAPSDHGLIVKIRNGGGAAFEKLIRRY